MAINITNRSVDDIYMDIDNIDQNAKRVKKILSNINDDLTGLKKIYSTLANDSKTKGNFKKSIQEVVNSCEKYRKNNAKVRAQLENNLTRSAAEYVQALRAFDELDSLADDLAN